LDEKQIREKFLLAYNQIMVNREYLLDDSSAMLQLLTDTSAMDEELAKLQSEQEIVIELTRKIVAENAAVAMPQGEYIERYTALVDRYESLAVQMEELKKKRQDRLSRAQEIQMYMKTVVGQNGELQEFDPRVWLDVIDKVVVYNGGRMVFHFKDRRTIEI
jgi:hypothetical protein